MDDFDPKKHVLRRRRGVTIYVDKQILRWRAKMKKMKAQAAEEKKATKPDRDKVYKNFFTDDE